MPEPSERPALRPVKSLHDSVVEDDDLIRRLVRPGPRYTSYPTAPSWSEEVDDQVYQQKLALAAADSDSPLSLYFHLPFCREMCRYCGCSVVVTQRPERIDHYLTYVTREMELVAQCLGGKRRVDQLHLGGGTPTSLDERQLTRLWESVKENFEVDPAADLALEADPRVTRGEQLARLAEFGFTRLSLGVQDFDPEVQQAIGRIQSREQTEALFLDARRLGFRTINFDLVYGLPKQRKERFAETLEQVIEMGPDRLAVFSYAHVPWMRPHQRAIDESWLPDPVSKLRLFEMVRNQLLAAGYVQIGMDHFALPDDELARARLAHRLHRNFQGYTTRPTGDTLAFGITSISDLQGTYVQNVKKTGDYYARLDEGRLAVDRGCVSSNEDRLRRAAIHGIMCNFSVDLDEIAEKHGFRRGIFAPELKRLDWAEECGLIVRSGARVELTARGQLFVRNVAMVFDTYLPQQQQKPTFSSTV